MSNRIRRLAHCLLLCLSTSLSAGAAADTSTHFNPKGNPPSVHTRAAQDALRATLPFEDERDFEEHRRGFIAAPAEREIRAADGSLVWSMAAYDFLEDGGQHASIHP